MLPGQWGNSLGEDRLLATLDQIKRGNLKPLQVSVPLLTWRAILPFRGSVRL
jgi:hypothetical protein